MLNSAQQLCQFTCYPNISSLTWYKYKQIALQMKKKLAILCRNKFFDPDGSIYQVKVGLPGEWSIISWRLSSRPGLEPPELELEPATFRQALGLAFALRSANFMVGPPTVTPKFVKGLWLLIRTENMLDQVVVSILVRTCLFLSKKGITTLISRIFLHVSTFFYFH